MTAPFALAVATTLALAQASGPSVAVAATFPSVEQATFHQLLFANDDVAVLKNVYPRTAIRDIIAICASCSMS